MQNRAERLRREIEQRLGILAVYQKTVRKTPEEMMKQPKQKEVASGTASDRLAVVSSKLDPEMQKGDRGTNEVDGRELDIPEDSRVGRAHAGRRCWRSGWQGDGRSTASRLGAQDARTSGSRNDCPRYCRSPPAAQAGISHLAYGCCLLPLAAEVPDLVLFFGVRRAHSKTLKSLEHRMGFEPMNTGFADQRVSHFAIGAHVYPLASSHKEITRADTNITAVVSSSAGKASPFCSPGTWSRLLRSTQRR